MANKSLKESLLGNRCYVSLACSISSISLAWGSLLQIPNATDRITLQRGLFLTSLGFIYFISLTDFCNKYLLETQHGKEFRKKYRLMISDVMEITNKIVSAVQASFSFLVGFIVCKSTCTKSFVYASHFLMEAYGWFGTAYFMYDIWSMYKVHTQKIADKLKLMRVTSNTAAKYRTSSDNGNSNGALYDKHDRKAFNVNGKGSSLSIVSTTSSDITPMTGEEHNKRHEDEIYSYDGRCAELSKVSKWGFLKYVITHPVMMIHHIFIGTFGLLVVTYIRGGGHCIYSYMFMMEFSTPFVSLRSILSTMGLKDTRFYIMNGLTMLGTFFVCRVCMWPYVMWRYSVAIDATVFQAMTGLPRGCIISILILFLPQIYWFFLMVKGALKVFFPTKSKQLTVKALQSQSKNNNLSPTMDNPLDFIQNAQLEPNGNLNVGKLTNMDKMLTSNVAAAKTILNENENK